MNIMGNIEDNRIKRKDTDSDPLKKIGNRETNKELGTDKKTIKEQKKKK